MSKEQNGITSSYSIGLTYKPTLRTTFKVHVGQHRQVRILDLNSKDDIGMKREYEDIKSPFTFLQITPSISYTIVNQKIKLPVEFGISFNKRTNLQDIFYILVKEYSYDVRMSTGLQYAFDTVNLGMNVVYSHAINEYQLHYEYGKYKPYQIGAEFVVGYLFK